MFKIENFQQYQEAYELSINKPEVFWAEIANHFQWHKKWDSVYSPDFINGKNEWFTGGELNITENCLDRHLATKADEIAILWEPNEPSEHGKSFTFQEVYNEVCRMANVLKSLNIGKGDRVCIYMPMIPETMFALLACARIGAIHSVVFAGFSANSIADRVNDAQAKAIITSDALARGAKQIPVKAVVDEALEHCDCVESVLVIDRLNWPVQMKKGRDYSYQKLAPHFADTCPAEPMDAEDPLFILYTSGSTGKPKGVVHTCGGYMVYAGYSFANVFQCKEGDRFWCTADVGWITGHTYLTYAPLLNGITTLIFEGVPTYPSPGRFWQVIDKYAITHFYTAPTAIRSLMAAGVDHVLAYGLYSLKVLGSVGEPINQEAFQWYHLHVGKGRCPIVDTWWQTETGGVMISSLAGISESIPTVAGRPLPGVVPVLLNQEGQEVEGNDVEGYLCIKQSWPGIIRTTYGDHERCRQTYFGNYPNYYFTGDGAKRTAQGLIKIQGRVDDVINVSGHRFGTAEIENAINVNSKVVESAVVGFPHDIKGQGIYAFVIPEVMPDNPKMLVEEITETIVDMIGRIAKPDRILIVDGLPKTRSGKIMRRILRKIAEGEYNALGDTSTLLDPEVVDRIKAAAKDIEVLN